jgi:membrane protein implicated in regulation of membrane protease activity
VRFLIAALLLQQTVAGAQVPAAAGELPVQMGYRVNPDTVLIAQQFNLFIKVLAPKGVRFEFPLGPDTASQNGVRPIEIRGEKIVSMLGDTAVALYHLVAWDVGTQPLRFPDVRVSTQGQERLIPLGGASVFVKSVLPADTSLRIPKPARPLIVLPVFNWLLWGAILAAAIALILLWWAWRRYRNRPKPPIDPYVRAQQEFARIEARKLVEKDEPEEYVAAMVDVVREYLAARVPGVRRSNTTTELVRAMDPREGVEAGIPDMLERADMVKFARAGVGVEEAKRVGATAREIVDHVEARLNPESEPGKRSSAAKARAA